MPHCRSAGGAWKHAQKSYLRGYLPRPPAYLGVEMPPPPPISIGDEPLEEELLPPLRHRLFCGDELGG